jgi:branched-chain amino acid transport system ATP-binding protein
MEVLSSLFYTEGITVKFGGLTALKNVNIKIGKGEIRGLIGPNGAGKSTFFNAVTNYVQKESGRVLFKGEDISNFETHKIAEKGITRTFQKRGILPDLTVLENVLTGYHRLMDDVRLWDICARTKKYKNGEREAIASARQGLELVGMSDISERGANDLSFGQQTLMEIAKALVSKPKLLLLDEPAAGLSSSEREHLRGVLTMLAREREISLIISDHIMDFVMGVCDDLTVLNFGEILAEGDKASIRRHRGVLEAYLGTRG